MLVELKNGETLNGHLVLCDTWMNLTLREVVQTSPVGFPSWGRRDGGRETRGLADAWVSRRGISLCGCRRFMSKGIM